MAQRNAREATELERQDLIQRRRDDDMRYVLNDPRGRRFLWELLGDCGLYRLSYEHSGSATMFKEGERNVALRLMTRILEVDHASYLIAQDEARMLAVREAEHLKNTNEE